MESSSKLQVDTPKIGPSVKFLIKDELEDVEQGSASESKERDSQLPKKHSNQGDKNDSEKKVSSKEILVRVPPDGGFGWFVVFMSFITILISDGIIFTYGKTLRGAESKFDVPQTDTAMIASIQISMYYGCGPFVSAVVNRFGFRLVPIAGAITAIITAILVSFVNSFHYLYGLAVINGISYAMISVPSLLIVGFYFDKYRATATCLATCGTAIGLIIGARLHTHLLDTYGFSRTVQVDCIWLSLVLLTTQVFRPVKPQKVQAPINEGKNSPIESETSSIIEFEAIFSRNLMRLPAHFDLTKLNNSDCGSINNTTHVVNSERSPTGSDRLSTAKKSMPDKVLSSTKDKLKSGIKCLICCCRCCLKRENKVEKSDSFDEPTIVSSRYFHRTATQTGSLHLVPDFMESIGYQFKFPKEQSSQFHYLSVITLPEDNSVNGVKKNESCCKPVTHALSLLFDAALLKNWLFISITISSFLYTMGFILILLYATEHAIQSGISHHIASWIISIIGVGNIFGRLAAALTSLIPKLDSSRLVGGMMMYSGLSIIASTHLFTNIVPLQILFYVSFGFTIAFQPSLRSVIVVQHLGLERLTNAYGMSSLFMGLAPISSGYIGSVLQKWFSYSTVLIMAGLCYIFSGVFLTCGISYAYYLMEQREKKNRRPKRRKPQSNR